MRKLLVLVGFCVVLCVLAALAAPVQSADEIDLVQASGETEVWNRNLQTRFWKVDLRPCTNRWDTKFEFTFEVPRGWKVAYIGDYWSEGEWSPVEPEWSYAGDNVQICRVTMARAVFLDGNNIVGTVIMSTDDKWNPNCPRCKVFAPAEVQTPYFMQLVDMAMSQLLDR